jgi:hypothetical protein
VDLILSTAVQRAGKGVIDAPNEKPRLQFTVESELEGEKDIGDVLADLGERVYNPKPLKRASFPECYVKDESQLQLTLGLAFPDSTGFVTGYYLAVFDCFHLGQEPKDLDEDVGGNALDPSIGANGGLSGEVQFPVLVPVGEFVEPGEWVRVGILPSMVRLHTLDDPHVERGQASGLVFPHFEGSLVVFGIGEGTGVEGVFGEDRELRSSEFGISPDHLDQQPHQMVEGRPPVVDDVSDYGAEFWGRLPYDLQPRDVVVGLNILFVDGSIRIASEKRLDGILKFLEMFLSPLHL